jgi:hypothetical protein
MRHTPDLDSKISRISDQAKQLKGCATRLAGHYLVPLKIAGVAQW